MRRGLFARAGQAAERVRALCRLRRAFSARAHDQPRHLRAGDPSLRGEDLQRQCHSTRG